jgi:hypothetical protein
VVIESVTKTWGHQGEILHDLARGPSVQNRGKQHAFTDSPLGQPNDLSIAHEDLPGASPREADGPKAQITLEWTFVD